MVEGKIALSSTSVTWRKDMYEALDINGIHVLSQQGISRKLKNKP